MASFLNFEKILNVHQAIFSPTQVMTRFQLYIR